MKNKNSTKLKVKKNFNLRFAVLTGIIIAGIGAYLLFFASAAVNNCSTTSSQVKASSPSSIPTAQVCDVNQVSNPSGTDAAYSVGAEYQNLVKYGWTDWGVAFRAPTTALDGAKPVHRFYRTDITAHFLIIESDPLYTQFKADPANYIDEGIFFYAWDAATKVNRNDIEEVYRVNRKPLYFLQMYSTNEAWVSQFVNNADKTWENGGIAFYAFPSNFFPPVISSTPTKDTNCVNQNLKTGDKGACVKSHKAVLNGYGAKLDVNNDTFDTVTNDNTRLFVTALKNKGVAVSAYSNIVTAEIWNALAKGYPPVLTTPPSPAAVPSRSNSSPSGGTAIPSNQAPVKVEISGGGSVATTPGVSSNAPCPTNPDTKVGTQLYLEAIQKGTPLSTDCHTFWLTLIKNDNTRRAQIDAVNKAIDGVNKGLTEGTEAINQAASGARPTNQACNMAATKSGVYEMSQSVMRSRELAMRMTTITIKDPKDPYSIQALAATYNVNVRNSKAKAMIASANEAIRAGDCIAAQKIAFSAVSVVTGLADQLKQAYNMLVFAANKDKIVFSATSKEAVGAVIRGGKVIRFIW